MNIPRLTRYVGRRLSAKLLSDGEPSMRIEMADGSQRQFYYRETEADHGVIQQVFKDEDYSLRGLRRGKVLREVQDLMPLPLIIDAGANIGASAVWFAKNFPRAKIIAFEPDEDNFALLARNAEGLKVDVRNVALGSQNGIVSMVDPGHGDWGFQTVEDAKGQVPLVSMSMIVNIAIASGHTPFIAKIDIEGGESELFSQNTDWVDRFPLIIVELHDWLLPTQGTSRNFLKIIASKDRDFVHIGENIFSIRNG